IAFSHVFHPSRDVRDRSVGLFVRGEGIEQEVCEHLRVGWPGDEPRVMPLGRDSLVHLTEVENELEGVESHPEVVAVAAFLFIGDHVAVIHCKAAHQRRAARKKNGNAHSVSVLGRQERKAAECRVSRANVTLLSLARVSHRLSQPSAPDYTARIWYFAS